MDPPIGKGTRRSARRKREAPPPSSTGSTSGNSHPTPAKVPSANPFRSLSSSLANKAKMNEMAEVNKIKERKQEEKEQRDRERQKQYDQKVWLPDDDEDVVSSPAKSSSTTSNAAGKQTRPMPRLIKTYQAKFEELSASQQVEADSLNAQIKEYREAYNQLKATHEDCGAAKERLNELYRVTNLHNEQLVKEKGALDEKLQEAVRLMVQMREEKESYRVASATHKMDLDISRLEVERQKETIGELEESIALLQGTNDAPRTPSTAMKKSCANAQHTPTVNNQPSTSVAGVQQTPPCGMPAACHRKLDMSTPKSGRAGVNTIVSQDLSAISSAQDGSALDTSSIDFVDESPVLSDTVDTTDPATAFIRSVSKTTQPKVDVDNQLSDAPDIKFSTGENTVERHSPAAMEQTTSLPPPAIVPSAVAPPSTNTPGAPVNTSTTTTTLDTLSVKAKIRLRVNGLLTSGNVVLAESWIEQSQESRTLIEDALRSIHPTLTPSQMNKKCNDWWRSQQTRLKHAHDEAAKIAHNLASQKTRQKRLKRLRRKYVIERLRKSASEGGYLKLDPGYVHADGRSKWNKGRIDILELTNIDGYLSDVELMPNSKRKRYSCTKQWQSKSLIRWKDRADHLYYKLRPKSKSQYRPLRLPGRAFRCKKPAMPFDPTLKMAFRTDERDYVPGENLDDYEY